MKNAVLIGCGVITEHYVKGLQKTQKLNIVACCDINEHCNSRKLYDFVPFYTDVNEMLSNHKVDYAIISTPVKVHLKTAIELMKKGISVLIEKPMVRTLDDLEALYSSAKENGVSVHGMLHWVYADEVDFLKNNLKNYGKIKSISITINDDYACNGNAIREDRQGLDGAWRDSGINALSFLSAIIDINDLKLVFEESEIDSICNQDCYAKRQYDCNGVSVQIVVDWRENTNQKVTVIETESGLIFVNHNEQKICLNNEEIFKSIVEDRLESHYENLFGDIDLTADNSELERKLHSLLLSNGEK